jgi:hypothetical protein
MIRAQEVLPRGALQHVGDILFGIVVWRQYGCKKDHKHEPGDDHKPQDA